MRLAALVATVAAAALVLAAGAGLLYLRSLPSVADAPVRVAATLLKHHSAPGRPPVPEKLAAAVVSVEDEHFYSNTFVNVASGVGRAALAALHGGGDPGGSTIPQQLAKELYGSGSGLASEIRDLGLGMRISMAFPRSEVLRMYLDAGYYGNGYWGFGAAARGYFGVSPRRLTWAEATLLAGLLQAPSAYDPLHHYALARERQRHVLDQLVANGHLTPAQAAAAYRSGLPLTAARPGSDAAVR